MAEQTKNLRLYKYNKVTDAEEYVDIDDLVNDNWGKIDEFAGKQDIAIQALQTKATILEEENRLLKSQLPTEVTEKNKSIIIKNGSNLPFKSIEIEGDTEQENCGGVNIFNEAEFAKKEKDDNESCYYSYNKETGITMLKADDRVAAQKQYAIPVKSNNTYFIKIHTFGYINSITIFECDANKDYINSHLLNEDNSITTSSNCAYLKFGVNASIFPANIGHVIISEQDVKYEPYNMPSLNYPSEVRGCGENVNIGIVKSNGLEKTDINYQEKTYTIPVQKSFHKEDRFIKQNGKWYEQHNWNIEEITHLNNVTRLTTGTNDKYRFAIDVDNALRIEASSVKEEIYCNKFLKASRDELWNNVEGIAYDAGYSRIMLFSNEIASMTVQEFKNWLLENYVEGNSIKVTYKLEIPELIECTEEQNTVLDELQEDENYRGTLHIGSNNEIKPNLKIEYYKDIELEMQDISTAWNNNTTLIGNIGSLLDTINGEEV